MASKNISTGSGSNSITPTNQKNGYYVGGGAPSYVRTNLDTSGTKNAQQTAQKYSTTASNVKAYDSRGTVTPVHYVEPSNDSSGGGGGGGSSSGGGGSSSGGGYPSAGYFSSADYENDILNKIKELLTQQEESAKQAYKSMYDQELAKNKEAYETARDQINVNKEKADRYSDQLYSPTNMSGVSNKIRNYNSWLDRLQSNRQNYNNNNQTSLTRYNTNLSNAYDALRQGWYNNVLSTMTNRQNYQDSLANQLKLNELDYDYRKYLSDTGMV